MESRPDSLSEIPIARALSKRDQSDLAADTRKAKTFFMAAAGASFSMSVWLFFSGDYERGIFVGLWVPSILSAGTLLLTRAQR